MWLAVWVIKVMNFTCWQCRSNKVFLTIEFDFYRNIDSKLFSLQKNCIRNGWLSNFNFDGGGMKMKMKNVQMHSFDEKYFISRKLLFISICVRMQSSTCSKHALLKQVKSKCPLWFCERMWHPNHDQSKDEFQLKLKLRTFQRSKCGTKEKHCSNWCRDLYCAQFWSWICFLERNNSNDQTRSSATC